jgi:type IV secretion system protein VirB6
MAMVLRVAGSIVSGWQVFGLAAESQDKSRAAPSELPPVHATSGMAFPAKAAQAHGLRRTSVLAPDVVSSVEPGAASASNPAQLRTSRTHVTHIAEGGRPVRQYSAQRVRGIGSRFASRPRQSREMIQ